MAINRSNLFSGFSPLPSLRNSLPVMFFFILMSAFSLVSCVKERSCHCTFTDDPSEHDVELNVDAGIKCEKVSSMGFEELVNGEWVTTARSVSCREIGSKK